MAFADWLMAVTPLLYVGLMLLLFKRGTSLAKARADRPRRRPLPGGGQQWLLWPAAQLRHAFDYRLATEPSPSGSVAPKG